MDLHTVLVSAHSRALIALVILFIADAGGRVIAEKLADDILVGRSRNECIIIVGAFMITIASIAVICLSVILGVL